MTEKRNFQVVAERLTREIAKKCVICPFPERFELSGHTELPFPDSLVLIKTCALEYRLRSTFLARQSYFIIKTNVVKQNNPHSGTWAMELDDSSTRENEAEDTLTALWNEPVPETAASTGVFSQKVNTQVNQKQPQHGRSLLPLLSETDAT